MAEVKRDNPAGRLYAVLVKLLGQKSRNEYPFGDALALIFELDPNDISQQMDLLSNLVRLVQQVLDCLAKTGDIDQDLYAEPVVQIKRNLQSMNIYMQLGELHNRIDQHMLKGLRYASDTLSSRMRQEVIADEELDKIRKKIDVLIKDVANSDIVGELREYMLRYLGEIRAAILNYDLFGTEGVVRIADSGVFGMAKAARYADTDEAKSFVRRVTDVVTDVNTWITLGTTAVQISQFFLTAQSQLTYQPKRQS